MTSNQRHQSRSLGNFHFAINRIYHFRPPPFQIDFHVHLRVSFCLNGHPFNPSIIYTHIGTLQYWLQPYTPIHPCTQSFICIINHSYGIFGSCDDFIREKKNTKPTKDFVIYFYLFFFVSVGNECDQSLRSVQSLQTACPLFFSKIKSKLKLKQTKNNNTTKFCSFCKLLLVNIAKCVVLCRWSEEKTRN